MFEAIVLVVILICLAGILGPSETPKEKASKEEELRLQKAAAKMKQKNQARRAKEQEKMKKANIRLKDKKDRK